MREKDISGVILAGGSNKRFNGTIKSLILINGKPVIARMLDTISEIFEEIIIVTNTPDEFRDYERFKIIGDVFRNKGPLAGIHAALKETRKKNLFLFAGDMPLVDKDLIIRQVEFFKINQCEVLIPEFETMIEPLHSIYSKSITPYLEEYLQGNNNYAIREFVKNLNLKYMPLNKSEDNLNVFTNINSPADIKRVENILTEGLL